MNSLISLEKPKGRHNNGRIKKGATGRFILIQSYLEISPYFLSLFKKVDLSEN